jgi:hypothetical protein
LPTFYRFFNWLIALLNLDLDEYNVQCVNISMRMCNVYTYIFFLKLYAAKIYLLSIYRIFVPYGIRLQCIVSVSLQQCTMRVTDISHICHFSVKCSYGQCLSFEEFRMQILYSLLFQRNTKFVIYKKKIQMLKLKLKLRVI